MSHPLPSRRNQQQQLTSPGQPVGANIVNNIIQTFPFCDPQALLIS